MALYRASIRRALGLRRSWRQKVAPFVLLAVVTLPAVINVGIGYVTRDRVVNRIEIVTYRDYVGVSSALLLFVAIIAPDVMCPDRRQRVLPLMFARPLTGFDYVLAKFGAIASIMFAFSVLPQMVLFLGNMLVSNSALDYLTGHLDVLWKVPARRAGAGRVLRHHRRRRVVADRPPDRRRRVHHRHLPRHVDRRRRSSSATTSAAAAARRPRSSTSCSCRCTCATSSSSAWSTRAGRSTRCPTAVSSPLGVYVARAGDRGGDPAVALPLGGAMSLVRPRSALPPPESPPPRPAVDERRRSGVRRRAHGRDQRRVGVVRGQGGAVRAELLVRRRRHRPARPERRRQDDVDAGDHRHEPGQPGLGPRRRSRPAP